MSWRFLLTSNHVKRDLWTYKSPMKKTYTLVYSVIYATHMSKETHTHIKRRIVFKRPTQPFANLCPRDKLTMSSCIFLLIPQPACQKRPTHMKTRKSYSRDQPTLLQTWAPVTNSHVVLYRFTCSSTSISKDQKRPTNIWREELYSRDLPTFLRTWGERWGAGVETQKNVRGEIGGWGRVPFNETYAPSLSTIYDGA